MKELDLDWGTATPEGYDDANREALHVLNVNFIGEANRNRVVKFACARVLHFHRHCLKAVRKESVLTCEGNWSATRTWNVRVKRYREKLYCMEFGYQSSLSHTSNGV